MTLEKCKYMLGGQAVVNSIFQPMQTFNFPIKKKARVLALGAESAGRFAFYKNGNIFISENFGDLLNEDNFSEFKKEVLKYIKREKPDIILTDLHPLYNSTIFGQELSKKLKIPQIKIQHHIAHIFSAVGDRLIIQNSKFKIQNSDFIGIAADGTGYGLDGNIWGGEIFKFKVKSSKLKVMERVGSLEEQIMIGGDLAVKEPARMLIAILSRIMNHELRIKNENQSSKIIKAKNDIYRYVKKFYTRNEFELLYSQLRQGFNCQTTTSAGRILDAVSLLLGFAGNKRNFKHEAAKLLEKNSTKPYANYEFRILNNESQTANCQLPTTNLFQYLLKNINKDKMRLAATAQEYIAKGFYEMAKKIQNSKHVPERHRGFKIQNSYFAGGMANNKIMSAYLEKRGVYTSQKISRGDEGLAFGQIVCFVVN